MWCNFKGKNYGGTASGSVSVGLYLSTDTTITSQDLLVGTCSLGSLNQKYLLKHTLQWKHPQFLLLLHMMR